MCEKDYQQAGIEEVNTVGQVAECGNNTNQVAKQTENSFEEKDIMFELEPIVFTEFGDKTCQTEQEMKRFLATLTEAQLAETEVIFDDETFVVFYPLLPQIGRPSGYHFDTDYPRPTVASVDVPELVGLSADQGQDQAITPAEREAGLAILLASVRL